MGTWWIVKNYEKSNNGFTYLNLFCGYTFIDYKLGNLNLGSVDGLNVRLNKNVLSYIHQIWDLPR